MRPRGQMRRLLKTLDFTIKNVTWQKANTPVPYDPQIQSPHVPVIEIAEAVDQARG
jgi:hypothetical protein